MMQNTSSIQEQKCFDRGKPNVLSTELQHATMFFSTMYSHLAITLHRIFKLVLLHRDILALTQKI
jgi:hypothetical protein